MIRMARIEGLLIVVWDAMRPAIHPEHPCNRDHPDDPDHSDQVFCFFFFAAGNRTLFNISLYPGEFGC